MSILVIILKIIPKNNLFFRSTGCFEKCSPVIPHANTGGDKDRNEKSLTFPLAFPTEPPEIRAKRTEGGVLTSISSLPGFQLTAILTCPSSAVHSVAYAVTVLSFCEGH